jgi:hypothetical protein
MESVGEKIASFLILSDEIRSKFTDLRDDNLGNNFLNVLHRALFRIVFEFLNLLFDLPALLIQLLLIFVLQEFVRTVLGAELLRVRVELNLMKLRHDIIDHVNKELFYRYDINQLIAIWAVIWKDFNLHTIFITIAELVVVRLLSW